MTDSDQKDTAVAEKETSAAAAQNAPEKNESQPAEKENADSRAPFGSRGRGRRERAPREPKEFEEAVLQIRRVTRVNKGGRQLRFSITVAVGNKKGQVGFGNGKSSEVVTGIQKAVAAAKKKLITVEMTESTIPHPVREKFKSSQVFILPAPEGKGIIAGGAVRKILELAGVKNALSKMHGSRNKINIATATLRALEKLSPAPQKTEEKATEVETEAPKTEAPKKETAKKATPKKPAKKPAAKKSEK